MNTLLSSDEALDVIRQHYDPGEISYCMFINRGFNDHYLIACRHQKYIFRLYLNHKYYVDSFNAYRFEVDLLDHLYSKGVPVANALATKDGELLGSTSTSHGERAFALFSCADGMQLSGSAITIRQSYQFGKTMADLHVAANSFNTEHQRYKLDLRYLIDEPVRLISEGVKNKDENSEYAQHIHHGEQIIKKLEPIDRIVDTINSIGSDNDEFGIIHADLHNGNVHFHGDTLTVFDFDHCGYGWRAYDLAISYFLPEPQRNSMIKGYESVRPLSSEERGSLQGFGNLRNLWNIGDILATEVLREKPPR